MITTTQQRISTLCCLLPGKHQAPSDCCEHERALTHRFAAPCVICAQEGNVFIHLFKIIHFHFQEKTLTVSLLFLSFYLLTNLHSHHQ